MAAVKSQMIKVNINNKFKRAQQVRAKPFQPRIQAAKRPILNKNRARQQQSQTQKQGAGIRKNRMVFY